jgi:nuclear GTP-binding protein
MSMQAEEEKSQKKEAKKAARADAKAAAASGADAGASDDEGFDAGAIGVNAVSGRAVKAAKGKGAVKAAPLEEDSAPALVNPDLPHLESVLDAADVVIHVLDARDPMAYRSTAVEDAVAAKGKKLLYVLNKIGERTSAPLCRMHG